MHHVGMGFLKNIATSIFGFGGKPPRRPATSAPAPAPAGGGGKRRGTVRDPSIDDYRAGVLLDEIGREENDVRAGKIMPVQSSNVEWFRWEASNDTLQIGYKDGSVYEYYDIPLSMAMDMYRAGSKGGFVWDRLRRRGTVFGYQKEYAFLSGASTSTRIWHEGLPGQRDAKGKYIKRSQAALESRKRHGAIGPAGEPFAGYHPAFGHAVGGLGKKRGSGAKKASRRKKGPF